ncbi:predicted protein [Naegleria gruberi]|uniref:Predicted protein n=1 Tax=Naegleria gruberi TaxID=5762 RepID=D2VQ19_NAEGR|nr:uncharacterized protein NAEGRDRAFT_71132 [Naegleria gruberi]EFC41100.1 predicted protein [Naegleria gruberi]|eukprot:XP_002673844.1 predicted protein [Naegleria gruberi strain NEG-M]
MKNSNIRKKEKVIKFMDETCKTLNRIHKKKEKISAKHELRKQLCNDDLLKNYFVLNPEKDETVVFRIENTPLENEQVIVTKHSMVTNVQSTHHHEPNPPVQVSETIRNDPQPDEIINTIHNQQEMNQFLLQLCCALIHQQEGQKRSCFQ